ncbi:uroporphyrin-III C-methyltransferase / precorrin-2 dehydrogenase / sirohydrochlorin ferrochelatase [Jannaschia faecimaris]|uniref:Uroporphyrin-III C-methyltransferase / precorrin-2 dehydrogenase / sirohydrochlorin ferrochelatase n=1 Tax=Jannaschia faecimaris TaxID=1244108 RepID=A0A1H3RMF6_9RHOB|nr:siroheme synthase CysG [Jannaschia faecimaris]SDZ26867.1 uroporphyrin-III C-methyltransferase / precorrin-2 dehydrogenase / sirohydrochlorin ferrochelatase [Jannaschia faecimaris]
MNHFPIFLALEGRRVLVAGGGDAAIAKLRLLLKTTARITVVAENASPEIRQWAEAGKLTLIDRAQEPGDALCCVVAYGAHEDVALDARTLRLAAADGALVNLVDNLEKSQFITPAIVDRDPVVVAIGTEGAAPVLARKIKADLEAKLSAQLGVLARIGKTFRKAADVLPMGAVRRRFWGEYYDMVGPRAAQDGEAAIRDALDTLLDKHVRAEAREGHVDLVGAGPGDPELLTLKARKALDKADVVIHDRLVTPEILELARREALILDVGKEGFGPSTAQSDIDALIVEHARKGAHVVRLKAGDPTVFGRLDEEIEALDAAGVSWSIVPGITAASAAVATIGQSLTKRSRNASVRFLTGHDMKGFADQDWAALAQPGEVAAIYMGKRAARWMQGRLMMHGAAAATDITIVENASRADQRIHAATLATLPDRMTQVDGPAVILFGLAPRAASIALSEREIAL